MATASAPARKTLIDPMKVKKAQEASRKFFHAAVPTANLEKTATATDLKRRMNALMGIDDNIQYDNGSQYQHQR